MPTNHSVATRNNERTTVEGGVGGARLGGEVFECKSARDAKTSRDTSLRVKVCLPVFSVSVLFVCASRRHDGREYLTLQGDPIVSVRRCFCATRPPYPGRTTT